MSAGHSKKEGSLHRLDLRLPPLPQTLLQALELLHAQGSPSAEDVARVIRRDPAVVSRILKQTNSAYYGLRRSVTDVERAVGIMGPTKAIGTIVSLCILEIDKLTEGPAGSCSQHLLRHSEATAFLTRYLLNERTSQQRQSAPAETPSSESNGFTAGLLHDFGKLVLIYNYPEKAILLYESRIFEEYLSETDPRMLEQLVFGCDHTEAGGYAASEMNFPQDLIDVIRYHHDLDDAQGKTDAMETLRAVGIANRSTKTMGAALEGVHPIEADLDWETSANHTVGTDIFDVDGREKEEKPMDLVEHLNEKREDVLLLSRFCVDTNAMNTVCRG